MKPTIEELNSDLYTKVEELDLANTIIFRSKYLLKYTKRSLQFIEIYILIIAGIVFLSRNTNLTSKEMEFSIVVAAILFIVLNSILVVGLDLITESILGFKRIKFVYSFKRRSFVAGFLINEVINTKELKVLQIAPFIALNFIYLVMFFIGSTDVWRVIWALTIAMSNTSFFLNLATLNFLIKNPQVKYAYADIKEKKYYFFKKNN